MEEIQNPHCHFDERACEATHKSIETRFTNINWIFGIVITLQLACFTFTGWLSTKVLSLDVDRATVNEKINTIAEKQNHVSATVEKIWEKINEKGKNP